MSLKEKFKPLLGGLKTDTFELLKGQPLYKVCNAPKDASGVYLIFLDKVSDSNLVYIGASGKIQQDGLLKQRKNGLNARIREGHHRQAKEPRRKVLPQLLQQNEMKSIIVKWYVTATEDKLIEIPTVMEALLIKAYFEVKGTLPEWNKAY